MKLLDRSEGAGHHFTIPATERIEACAPEEHARRSRIAPASDLAVETAAGIFRAAGDPARLRLLERLCDGEACVSELAEQVKAQISTVSQQLRVLRNDNLVSRRRAGKHIFYALADEHIRDLVLSALAHAAEPRAADLP
jgi:ArsR family transcriptional regulator, lead/cadmium/zinc/bismuth-responsive transcriptional repressor